MSYNLTDTEKAYLAGFIDGEGWLGIAKNGTTYSPALEISNKNEEVLSWAKGKIGGFFVHSDILKLRLVKPKDIGRALVQIRPYLIVKKQQAKLLLEFCASRLKARLVARRNFESGFPGFSKREAQIYEMLKELNRKRRT